MLAGVSISQDQINHLTKAFAEASAPFHAGGDADPTRIDWALADAAAARILTPAQFKFFTQIDLRQPTGDDRGTGRLIQALEEAVAGGGG